MKVYTKQAIIVDDNGWEWQYNERGIDGEPYRTLDVVYADPEEREEGSGYYATSFQHALYLLTEMGYLDSGL